ncbi:Transcription factor E2F4 [Collichthys lucidus]|uniref:Transcription factor E2F4 n=1 Tax=Collichthys lucidus TaxID=240159 RepID=A0A4U5U7F6_COLLU|nr:Transcription factor E2F4 [Collichthys lucidus]
MDPESTPTSPVGDCTVAEQNPKYQRSLRSLNLLATRFVMLLQQAEGGVLDIKDAVSLLAVGQKRRIYDITNVLEGVGLIVKISKSIVKWKLEHNDPTPQSPLREETEPERSAQSHGENTVSGSRLCFVLNPGLML